jgi:hypothetical protein
VAHFTRMGNFLTPRSAASRAGSGSPSPLRGASVSSAWNTSNSRSTSSTRLPFTCSVISDAEALEMAQPAPWKPASAIVPFSTFSMMRNRSPQSGLYPSADRMPSPSSAR